VATDFTSEETARLRRVRGRPVLMVFYSPTSSTVEEQLRFTQSVHDANGGRVVVIGLAMSSDADKVRKQHAELRLGYPVLNGQGLRVSYSVDATPRMVVIDADGIVRGSYVGWGGETAGEVTAELKKWPVAPK
jgi:peroxiredoxin